MTVRNPVIMLEFNELTPSLMARFMGEGKLPNFRRLFNDSLIYTSDAGEDSPNLNPWVQWVTVHAGLPFQDHKVFYLDDGHKLQGKCVWDLISDAGQRVWVCGSMNAKYSLPLNGAFMPDPWTTGAPPYPGEFSSYHRFVRKSVQEHTNADTPYRTAEYLDYLKFMCSHGLSFSTIWAIVSQLLIERSGKYRWKRVPILDKLQFDLFSWYFRKYRPSFSTFFVNSVAHFQHCYWREMEPWHFSIPPTNEDKAEKEAAILFGYQQLDEIVGRAFALAGDDSTLILCTALSQQPCVAYEQEGGKCFYRPKNFEKVFEFAGVKGTYEISPVMSEEFYVRFHSEEEARQAMRELETLRVASTPVLRADRKGNEIYTGCSIHSQVSPDAILMVEGSDRKAPFFELFYQGEGIKSGMHHRDGLLWIRLPNRQHRIHSEKVSLCSIAPTVLSLLGVNQPDSMKSPPLIDPCITKVLHAA